MSDFEIIMVVLGILTLTMTTNGLIIALLNFLDKRNNKHKS